MIPIAMPAPIPTTLLIQHCSCWVITNALFESRASLFTSLVHGLAGPAGLLFVHSLRHGRRLSF